MILCNEKRLKISASLVSILEALHRQESQGRFWIGAICINQIDDSENSLQVPLMEKIYSEAQLVLVWLGPCSDDSDMAMEQLGTLANRFEAVNWPQRVNMHNTAEFGLPPFTDLVWPATVHLYFRRWFTHLWVMQVAVLAKAIRVLCGAHHVEWPVLWSYANYFSVTELFREVMEHYGISREHLSDQGFYAVPHLNILRADRKVGLPTLLFSLLQQGRLKLSKEPVDKVYALLGLVNEEVHSGITIDYSLKHEYW